MPVASREQRKKRKEHVQCFVYCLVIQKIDYFKAVFLSLTLQVLNMQLADGGQGDVPVDENKLHGKPDKTLRFSLCSDNLEGISEGEGLLTS